MTRLKSFKNSIQTTVTAFSLAIAAGCSLSSGQAFASCPLTGLNGCTITAGDKTISDISFTGGGFTPTADQTLDFSIASGAWVVSTNFAPDQNTTLTPTQTNPTVLSYKITINDASQVFDKAAIQGDDTTINGGSTYQSVSISGITNPLVSNNGVNAGPEDFTSELQTITVNSTWYTDGKASFNNFSQKFTQKPKSASTAPVPGPLPLLGLGVAFGMSRRLRRRIA
jgi:hypothetical protein